MARANPAHTAVQKAVFSGALVVPHVCERCARKPRCGGRIHAHHEDYTKPLDVVWLCPSCHRLRHKSMAGRPLHEFLSDTVAPWPPAPVIAGPYCRIRGRTRAFREACRLGQIARRARERAEASAA